jgi:trimeric autotransporter adhesin
VEVTKKLLDMLPPKNKEALGILCRFLQQMSEYSDATLMDIKNLSVVFSPNILRPRVETPETLICDARAVYGTVADFMINNAAYFPLESDPTAAKPSNGSDDKSADTENVAPASASAPTEVKPILFTASTTEPSSAGPSTSTTSAESVVQQMDEQYTRMRRMSQRAITTLRKTKKLNDEELEATMLSISERIREGDIVVASSLMGNSPSNDRITFSIGDSASEPNTEGMVRSPSEEAAGPPPGSVRTHRAQALSHLPPMVRTGSSDGADGSMSPPSSASGSSIPMRRGNRKRDAPFALKDDELKNLQAEIEGAKDDAFPAALSTPTDNSPTAPRRKSTRRGSQRHSEKSSKKHRSSTRKSKSSKKHGSKSSKHEDAAGGENASSSTSKRSREYHRGSRERRDSNDKPAHVTVVTFKPESDDATTSASSNDEAKGTNSTSGQDDGAPSQTTLTFEAAVVAPAENADASAPTTPTASGRSSRAPSDAVRQSTSTDSTPQTASASGSNSTDAHESGTMATPRSDTSGGDQSDLDDDDDDDADPLRGIQNELLSALLGEAVADSSEEEEDNESSHPNKGDDEDEGSDDRGGEGSEENDEDS